MRIALVHDYIKEYGGAEKVLECLHELFPTAPVFTSVYLPEFLGPHKNRFENWDIHTSFLQHLPFKAKLISPFRLISAQAFKEFDFSDFDIIITSATGAYIPNLLNKKKAKLICYCHTPPIYLYGYATARELTKNPLLHSFAHIANHFLRMQDFRASQNVDFYIANSQEVAGRIKKFYRRECDVIYPPACDMSIVSKRSDIKKKTTYYLTGGRLARAKHTDLIIKTCLYQNLNLKVFGKSFAGYGDELKAIVERYKAPISANTSQKEQFEFLGEVSDEEKYRMYAQAKAFLFASEDEDFGIVPVESMAAGTPVIAFRSGGVQETIIDGKTGVFYDQLSIESLASAIKKFEEKKFDPVDCRRQAEKFSKDRFMQAMREKVFDVVK